MALNTRELLLILRVSDRTGGALRRVSRDIGNVQNRQLLDSQMKYRRSLAETTAIRAKDAREASRQATLALRNMRLQRTAAEQAISSMKAQQLQDAKTTLAIREQVAEYNRLTAAIGRQTDVARGLRTVRLQTAGAADFAASKFDALKKRDSELKWQGLERGARLAEHLGRALAIGGAIGVFALGGAARQAATVQTQVALAATQARSPGAPATQTLEKQRQLMTVVMNQMKQFPAASQDMANSLYEIFSGTNIRRVDQAANALKLFNQMAVAGGADLGTMTQAGISLINNFDEGQYSLKNLTSEANLFFAAVRFGRMNAQQFADSLSNVVPIAKEAGLQFRDVADAMAFLTRQSGAKYTSRDATGLMREIQLFARPEMILGMHRIGVEVETAGHKMRPLLSIIQDFVRTKFGQSVRGTVQAVTAFKTLSALGGQGTGSRGFQGTAQAARVFAFQINDFKEYGRVAQQVNRDQNEFNKSYAAMAQQPGVRWQVFINQLKALSIVIGSAVIPVFAQLGGYIETAVNWFQNLSPHTQKMIAQFALFTSVGALVGGTLLMIIGGFGSLFLTVRTGLRSFGLLGAETGALNIRMALMMGTVGALILILWKFPGLLNDITNAVGGLENMLILTAAIIAGLKFGPTIAGFVGLGAAAAGAAGEVSLLNLAVRRFLPIAIAYAAYQGIRGLTTDHPKGYIQRAVHAAVYTDATAVDPTTRMRNAGVDKYGRPIFRGSVGELEAARGVGTAAGRFEHGIGGANPRTIAQARQAAAALRNMNREAAVLAVQSGIPVANIQKLEMNVLKAQEALKGLDPAKNFKEYYNAELKLQNAQSALQAAATTAQSRAAMKAINARVAAETRAQKKALADQTREQKKALADQARAAKAAARAQNTTYADAFSNLKSMYQSFFQQQQQTYGNLFQGPVLTGARMQTITQWGGHATGADLLKDIRAQNFQYNRFNRLVGGLGRRGAPTELVNQLRAAGPAAMQDIYNLTKMTPQQWKAYVAAFKSGQAAIKQQTMAQLNSQIGLYQQHGKKVAQAIVAGITSQDQKVSRAIDNMLRKAIGLKPTADYKPKPHATTVNHNYHITGHPGDYHKTRSAIRHSLFRIRAHEGV